jgi:hypothetical protein
MWTEEKPNKEGFYFISDGRFVAIVCVSLNCDFKLVIDPGLESERSLNMYKWWREIKFPPPPDC